ncbi:MAG: hypothetical protein A4E49_01209 [Methanosaeta sp. PtaU1.Bin112]|nr:MAG: hypothetical protein A4E49_01209 [Methanosaeta sp. PtaU1.Bin112]
MLQLFSPVFSATVRTSSKTVSGSKLNPSARATATPSPTTLLTALCKTGERMTLFCCRDRAAIGFITELMKSLFHCCLLKSAENSI